MHLVHSRRVDFVDSHTLTEGHAREALFREESSGFILYLSGGHASTGEEERVLFVGLREALLWLNETPQERGSFWE